MTAADALRWARLSVVRRDYTLFITYADSLGREVTAPPNSQNLDPELWQLLPPSVFPPAHLPPGVVHVRWSQRANRRLFRLVGDLPGLRTGRHLGATIPVAVFLRPNVEITDVAFEASIQRLMRLIGLSDQRFALINEAASTAPTSRFSLPFDIGVEGRNVARFRSLVRRIVSELTPAEQSHAVRVYAIDQPSGPKPLPSLDIVVATADAVQARGLTQVSGGPRLSIIDTPATRMDDFSARNLPAGMSLVALPQGLTDPLEFTRETLLGLIHNWPLQEAVLAAVRQQRLTVEQRQSVRLISSPSGLASLSMSTALAELSERTRALTRYATPPGTESEPSVRPAGDWRDDADTVRDAIELSGAATGEFDRESDGFHDMARAESAQEAAIDAVTAIDDAAARFASSPDAAALQDRQQRRVTIWLTHDVRHLSSERQADIEARTTLARGGYYTLNVGIGIYARTDLVSAETPAIDPLLPPTQDAQRELTVAVFSDTSAITGPASKPLILPSFGPTEPVTFDFRAPRRRPATRLRIMLYFRGHLVQSFALDAPVTASAEWLPTPVIKVDLVFSRTRTMRNLDELGERLFSVATNDDSDRATHRLMFESGHSIKLSEKITGDAHRYFRKHLAETFELLGTNDGLTPTQFGAKLKVLAQSGRRIWGFLADQSQPLHKKFVEIAQSSEKTLQIVRLEPEFAFPWCMIYDWRLPSIQQDIDAADVCLGGTATAPCRCDPKTPGFCVRGFWGVRHVIEEFVRSEDFPVTEVSSGPQSPAVICTSGENDAWSQSIVNTLSKSMGAQIEDFAERDSLLERLWDLSKRPAVLVAVGHLSTGDQVLTEVPAPRIHIRARERYLDTEALRNAKEDHGTEPWETPLRPVVLLLGCGTSRTGLAEMHSFVSTLTSVGASAIIATEEKIDTKLAASLATYVVSSLATTGPGEGLRRWRTELMRQRNSLGLAFTCFGNSDVVVPHLVP